MNVLTPVDNPILSSSYVCVIFCLTDRQGVSKANASLKSSIFCMPISVLSFFRSRAKHFILFEIITFFKKSFPVSLKIVFVGVGLTENFLFF